MNRIFALLLVLLLSSTFSVAQTFALKSKDFNGQVVSQQIFNSFGCTGGNVSPQLSWENAPAGTKSFAVTMYDPDAPTGSGWWHWVAFDIPANIMELKANAGSIDAGIAPKECIQSNTDLGKGGYGGPCPPEGHGFHQYIITVYALKAEKLGLDKNANPALVGFYINSNMIQKATIVAYYKR